MKKYDGNIKVKERKGTWYVIMNPLYKNGKKYYVLEHEQYGDNAEWIVIDEQGNEYSTYDNFYDIE